MKAIVIDKPYEVEIRDVPMPTVGEGEALLRVLYVGICGADVASYTGNQPFTTYPRIPGHEFSAEIIEIPENDKGLTKGDVVTCNPYFNWANATPAREDTSTAARTTGPWEFSVTARSANTSVCPSNGFIPEWD